MFWRGSELYLYNCGYFWQPSHWFLDIYYIIIWAYIHTSTDPQTANPEPDISTDQEPATAGLSVNTVVGISIIIFLVSFSVGVLLATLIFICCCVSGRGKNSGQPQVSSSEDPHPAPLYDEVVAGKLELKENVAYGPVETLEMEQNPSYDPVGH